MEASKYEPYLTSKKTSISMAASMNLQSWLSFLLFSECVVMDVLLHYVKSLCSYIPILGIYIDAGYFSLLCFLVIWLFDWSEVIVGIYTLIPACSNML